MKKNSYYFIVLCLSALCSMQLFAQVKKGGTPPSFSIQSSTDVYDERAVAPIDVDKAIQEDAQHSGVLWAGHSIPVDFNMNNSGTWTIMPDGTKIWRLKISTSGAKALALCYDGFHIPKGGKLFLYNEYHTQVVGAYTEESNPATNTFSTELIQGSSINLEYVAPNEIPTKGSGVHMNGIVKGNKIINSNTGINLSAQDKPVISITELVYVYKNVPFLNQFDLVKTTGWGASGSCEVNVNCSPEGDNWQKQKRGVAEI